ncbi:sulfotransferase family 2 domain-containing protein [Leptolyngbya sp. PL-A3]
MHIPKTAGTTLGCIMVRQYGRKSVFSCHPDRNLLGCTPEDFKQLSAEERLRYNVVWGHFDFGLERDIEEPSTYITMLREPVDRAISHYYYARKRKDHYLHKKITSEKLKVKEYIVNGISQEMDNGQTRMLVKKGGWDIPFGELPLEFLEQAKQNLQENFAVVGTTERFDETLVLAKEIFGWTMPLYLRWNIGDTPARRANLSSNVVEAIYQHNALDVELHRYANELMDQLIAKEVPYFKLKLVLFRTLNRLYTQFFKVSRSFPKSWREKLDRRFFQIIR